jgi:hypothetical protein
MSKSVLACCLVVGAALIQAGCETTKSSNPLSPTIAGPIPGVVITAPKLLLPTAGQRIAVTEQPVTLTIENPTTTGVRPFKLVFEIAADAGFATKVFSREAVEPGTDGRTSVKLTDSLATGHTYYWRAMAADGANSGPYSSAVNFDVFTPIVIQAPTIVSPVDGVKVADTKPTLKVTNATRTGPAGAITYNFQISETQSFGAIVLNAVVPEGTSQTMYTATQDLAYSKTYYWRVRASDPTTTGPWSVTQWFQTPDPAPTPTPTPSPSPSTPAAGDQMNMSAATILNSPTDLASWPVTTSLQVVDIRPNGVAVQFSKKDGAGRWPDVTPPGWSGPLQYTLGMCLSISGRWYCSAVVEFWYGLEVSGGPPGDFATNWFYDPARWSPMTGHQPAVGETIGFFVCAGDCRNNTGGTSSLVKERSNVVLLPMPGNSGGTYRF